jgi:hypothetical protein
MDVDRSVAAGIEEAAKQALTRPDYYMYSGGDGDPSTRNMGRVFGMHRDSDILEVSNYETIKKDLESRFPDDIEELHDSHFLVGWMDTLCVRVYEIEMERYKVFTDAFKAAYEWKLKLDDYPVADEEDYSKREWEDFNNYITGTEGLPEEAAGWLSNTYSVSRPDDVTQEMLDAAKEKFNEESS